MANGGKREGSGRKKGVPNKLNSTIREMILTALDDAGGSDYLLRQANENPSAFMGLVGKVLPTQLTGEDGGAIKVESTDLAAKALSMLTTEQLESLRGTHDNK